MSSFRFVLFFLLLGFTGVALISCDNGDADPEPIVATTFSDLSADPGTGVNPNTGQPTGITNKFTFFSFKTGAMVANSDSASAKWDVGFRRTTIIVNGGTSGPGGAGAIVKSGLFEEIMEAPADGYAVDDKNSIDNKYAVPAGSGKGWYTYEPSANVVKPTAGKVLIFRTAEGKYAKVEIISYYKGSKTNPTSADESGYYSFRYVFQPNDSKSFN